MLSKLIRIDISKNSSRYPEKYVLENFEFIKNDWCGFLKCLLFVQNYEVKAFDFTLSYYSV